MRDEIPWKDAAVLTFYDAGTGERRIDLEASLTRVVDRLRTIPKKNWHLYIIALPDRAAFPLHYDDRAFANLVNEFDSRKYSSGMMILQREAAAG